ncbi:MAG: ABC transporter permease [Defluviitaleaceae bacterium]|nr:ABC transporter permease [Defluviitaleaceae bacterium]MCL2837110.1 ABC transporter permease [Defluviitaleaceae bacterium]
MHKYIIKRVSMMIPILLGVVLVSFFIVYSIPGDGVQMRLEHSATVAAFMVRPNAAELIEEYRQALIVELGLDKPLLTRLWNHYLSLAQPYLGIPRAFYGFFWTTLKLALISFLVTVVIGIPLGVISAYKHAKIFDKVTFYISLLFASVPSFVMANILMQYTFFSYNRIIPQHVVLRPNDSPLRWVIAIIAVSLCSIALIMFNTRSGMLESLGQNYILTARAKGAKPISIIWKHAFRNAMISIITIAGVHFAGLLNFVIFAETVARIPGITRLLMPAIHARDTHTIQSMLLLIGITVAIVNLIIDIAYAFIDPRIRSQYK